MLRWGENKLILEEALIGAAIAAAVAFLLVLAVLPDYAFRLGVYRVMALAGWPVHPDIVAYSQQHRLLASAGVVLPIGAGLVAAVWAFIALGWQRQEWTWQGMEFEADPESFGPRLAAHERALYSPAQAEAVRTRAPAPRGVRIGGVELSRTREVSHLAVYGLPGAGKTVLLRGLLRQALERGDRVLLHDPKGDFLDALAGPDSAEAVVVLGPWDARARPWDIAADIGTPERAVAFAGAIFGAGEGPNKFFVDAARETLAGVIKHLQRRQPGAWGWADLADILEGGNEAILGAAWDGEPAVRALVRDPSSRQTDGVLGEIVSAANWIPAYARAFGPEAQPFSVARWLIDPGPVRAVVLNSDARYSVRGEQLFGAMLAAAAATVSSPAMRERGADEPGYWLLIDELPQLGPAAQRAVTTIEEMGRSRGVRVVKAMQDPSQLDARAGREQATAQRAVQQTRIYLKLAPASAAEISQQLGHRDIRRVELPQVVGAGNKRVVKDTAPVIRAEDLMASRRLPHGVEAVVHIDDLIGRLVQPFVPLPGGAGAMIPNPRWDTLAPSRTMPVSPPAPAEPPAPAAKSDTDIFDF